ncbi:MAG: membrane protein [Dehalococcoidia bacterium]|nr:TRIC cation channel family protein [Tepidiformaceae bacterium]
MDIDASDLIGVLDRAGIVAFAFSGVEVGVRRKLDIFGLLVMGAVTSTGGGLMRDIVLGRLPLVVDRPDYLLWALGASLVASMLIWRRRRYPRFLLAIADAAGLGAFATAGALAGIQAELSILAVLLLAILTATGGGVVRDLLADRVPLVLRSEVNATAAAAGGLAVWFAEPVSPGGAALLGVSVTALVRVAGLAFNLHLPHPGGGDGHQGRLL